MTTNTDYALMAGASYISTRPDPNKFPVPAGWATILNSHYNDPATGFEATAFQRGTEIVISYAGTDPNDISGDGVADMALANGVLCDQLRQAAEYYLQIKAANPSAKITLTGHSLGGGLAALIAVMFGESAYTYDQAPFRKSANFYVTTNGDATQVTSSAGGRGVRSFRITFQATKPKPLRGERGWLEDGGVILGASPRARATMTFVEFPSCVQGDTLPCLAA